MLSFLLRNCLQNDLFPSDIPSNIFYAFSSLSFIEKLFFTIIIIIISGVRLSPLGTAATTGLLYEPQIIDDGDCGAIGGMNISRGNRSTRRKPAPALLCPPQILQDQNRARTRAAAVGSRQLIA
jgi:hypothetical protein